MELKIGSLYRDTQTEEIVMVTREAYERNSGGVVVCVLYLSDPENECRWSKSGFKSNFRELE